MQNATTPTIMIRRIVQPIIATMIKVFASNKVPLEITPVKWY